MCPCLLTSLYETKFVGHDCSVRWWDLGSRTCVQEHTSHRKRNNGGIWSVKSHPSLSGSYASCGADCVIKIYA